MPCDVTPGCSSSGALLVGELRRCAARQATVLCNDTHLPHPVHSGEGIVGRGKRAFCAVCGTRLCFALLRRGLFRGGARRKLVSIARGRVPEDRPLCSGWPLRRSSLSKERRGWPAEPGHAHNVYCAVGKRAPARVTTRPSADGTAHGSVSGALPFLLEPRLGSKTVAPPPPPNRRAWGILSRPVSSVDAAAELSTQHADILAADGGARPRSLVWLESSDAK